MGSPNRREWVWAAAQAAVVFLAVTGCARHAFMFDDNKAQWQPVTDFGVASLLRGVTPNWNPYVLNGVRVDEVGYYGFANPLLIVAHLVGRTGLTNTFTAYLFLAFVVGGVVMHALARHLGSGRLRAHLLVLAYQLAYTFWSHGHWYYVFHNALMFPVLLYAGRRFLDAGPADRRRWAWRLGAACGLAAGLGNAQYAAYQWLLVGVTFGVPLLLSGRAWVDRGHLVRVIGLAVLIASPTLWLAGDAGRFPLAGEKSAAAEHPIGVSAAYGAFVSAVRGRWLPDASSCLGLVPVALLGVGRRGWLGGAAAVGVAVVFAGGSYVADVPVLKEFRYAFKWWFAVPPLLLYMAALTPRSGRFLLPSPLGGEGLGVRGVSLHSTVTVADSGSVPPLTPNPSPPRGEGSRTWNPLRGFDFALILAAIALGVLSMRTVWPVGAFDPNTKADPATGRDLPPGTPLPGQPDHRLPATGPAEPDGFRELAAELDLANYRYLPGFVGPDFDAYRWEAFHTSQRFVDRYLTANAAARVRAFSPVGYHVGMRPAVAAAVDPLTRTGMFFLGSPVAPIWTTAELDAGGDEAQLVGRKITINGVPLTLAAGNRVVGPHDLDHRFWQVARGRLLVHGGGWGDLANWADDLQTAGVRYLVFRTEQIDDAVAYLCRQDRWGWSRPGTPPRPGRVIRTRVFSAIELPGAKPLVAGPTGESLAFTASASGLSVKRPPAGVVRVRFNAEPGFRAHLVGRDGKRVRATLVGVGGAMDVFVPAGDWARLEVRIWDRRVWAALALNLLAVGVLAGVRVPTSRVIRVKLGNLRRPSPVGR